ncbi:MAG: PAS domain S-box protein [Candidatus Sulfotelmatobacter sp.]
MLIPLESAEGMIVAATIREIAERKRVEKAVQEALATSAGQLKELADQKLALDEHAIVAVTDVQGTITYVNDKFCTISQYSRDELIGQNHRILKSGHHSKDFFQQMYDALANGTVWHGEIKNRAKDGSIYWVETTIVPFVGPGGKPQQYVSIRTDISKSKLAAEALVGKALELSRQAEELSRSRQALETQTRMLQSEARYRGLLEAAPDAMVVVNSTGEIVLLNVQAENQFGYSRDELIGQKVRNIIPQGFAERLIADGTRSAAEALAQQIGTGIELVGRRKDGSEFPLEIMLSPLESAEGILVTAAIRDISVRKSAEKHLVGMEERRRLGENALRESEERYRLLLDGVQNYAIFMMDTRGQILSWNAGAERIKGYSADQIIGRNFSCFFPPAEIERGRPEEILSMTAASGRHEEQGMRVRKDGSRFLANVVFTALRDAAGNLRGFSEFSHDLSESKESEARYRGLLEAAPDAMVVVNQAGEIVLLNLQAETQFGYRRDELLGQKVKNIIPEGFAERLIADGTRSAAEALAQQIGTGIELSGRRKDGSEFPIEIMLSPLESAEGTLVTAAIRDITERKESDEHLAKTVEELKRSNDDLQQFAYVSSHDLQEPLRMVSSYTQLLAKRYKGRLDSDADEFITFAVDGCNRMQGLIQDLLAYSRAGTNERKLREVPSENALQKALINLRAAIKQSGAVVTHDALPKVTTDETQLTQVFQNLVGNAIKYRRAEEPRVHVSAARNDCKEWTFSVRDNGLGIDSQYFERIFVLFQRLHGRDEFEGTGIGLAVCKRIVERMGGKIWVESQPEKGSTFYFALPDTEEK